MPIDKFYTIDEDRMKIVEVITDEAEYISD
jgi:hypothetical protein